jgi:hypothetical protein
VTAPGAARPAGAAVAGALSAPPFGAVTNGLPATSWVPFLDLAPDRADRLLAALAACGIAACRRLPLRPGSRTATARVWVDVTGHALAEDVVCSLAARGDPSVGA